MILVGIKLADISEGIHKQYILLRNNELFIDLKRNHVIAVFDQNNSVFELNETNNTTFFRKIPVAVATHGLAPSAITTLPLAAADGTPEYLATLSQKLGSLGYKYVLPFDWSLKSVIAAPFMANLAAIDMVDTLLTDLMNLNDTSFHLTQYDTIDIHFIGHSRGAVVISEALKILDKVLSAPSVSADPVALALSKGFVRMTMLDGHPANVRTLSFSNSWFAGTAVVPLLLNFQRIASDNDIEVPDIVDFSEAYYQETNVYDLNANLDSSERILNLWGVLPVSGSVDHKCVLTGIMGHGEVPVWYTENVAILLEPGTCFEDTLPRVPTFIPTLPGDLWATRRPDIAWKSVPMATTTEVWVNSLRTQTRVFYQRSVPENAITLPDALSEGQYAVWVRNYFADGTSTKWSARHVFEVLKVPLKSAVTVKRVPNGKLSPSISWDASPNASSYSVEIHDARTGTLVMREFTDQRSYSPTDGLSEGRYQFSVQAFQGEKPVTAIGSLAPFVVAESPTFTVSEDRVEWTASSDAVSNELWINRLTGDKKVAVINTKDLSSTWFDFENSLPPGRYQDLDAVDII